MFDTNYKVKYFYNILMNMISKSNLLHFLSSLPNTGSRNALDDYDFEQQQTITFRSNKLPVRKVYHVIT